MTGAFTWLRYSAGTDLIFSKKRTFHRNLRILLKGLMQIITEHCTLQKLVITNESTHEHEKSGSQGSGELPIVDGGLLSCRQAEFNCNYGLTHPQIVR